MNNTTQFLIGFIGIIMIGYLFVAVFQCKSVNNFEDTNTGIPANNTGIPANNTGIPANNNGIPANNTGIPANNTGIPANNNGIPANNNGISANNTGIPANNTGGEPEPSKINSSSNNNLQGSPTDAKEDIMFSEKQVTSIFKTQFNYGNLIYFTN